METRKVNHVSRLQKWAIRLFYFFLRLWYATLRVRVLPEAQQAFDKTKDRSCFFYFWHNALFMAPKIRLVCRPNRPMYGLVSASKDGALLEELLRYFNICTIRGSSSWRGKIALEEIQATIRSKNCDMVITPDGPRGPRYQAKEGSLKLAAQSQLPVVFFHFEAPSWKLKSWDHFRIVKPFSTITVNAHYCEKLVLDENLSDQANRYLQDLKIKSL